MTLSEQTSNTTLNIPHGVRRSDSPFLPPPPAFSVRSPLLLCPLHLGATSFLLPLAAVMWGPFCLGGFLFLVAPPFFLHVLFLCGPTWVMLSLPSFVLCLFFRSLSGFAFLGSWCYLSGASACVFFGASLSLLRSSPCLVGPRCFCLVFWLLSAPLPVRCCFPSPRGWSRVAPWPSFYAGTSL